MHYLHRMCKWGLCLKTLVRHDTKILGAVVAQIALASSGGDLYRDDLWLPPSEPQLQLIFPERDLALSPPKMLRMGSGRQWPLK